MDLEKILNLSEVSKIVVTFKNGMTITINPSEVSPSNKPKKDKLLCPSCGELYNPTYLKRHLLTCSKTSKAKKKAEIKSENKTESNQTNS